MMPKITSGSSLYGILAYNKMKLDDGTGAVIFTQGIVLPRRDPERLNIPLVSAAFSPCLAPGIRSKQTIFHCSLNPHPDDRLDDAALAEIAGEFMERMGYGGQPYVVYRHSDIDRTHLHVVAPRTRPDGTRIPDGMEGKRSQEICRELERKYGLRPLVKGESLPGVYVSKKVDYPRGNLKQQLSSAVRAALSKYGFASVKEFNTLLGLYNV